MAGEDHRDAFGWAWIVNHECEDAARAWFEWLEQDAKNLLKSHREFVEAVATELLKRGTLDTDQFQSITRTVLQTKRMDLYPAGLPGVTRASSA